ncbi:MAG: glycoside hydrolase family 38 N-terminal domain-containing protein [Hasllibacter sp.]
MRHRRHFTVEKIASRLKLIAPMIHRRRAPLPPFRHAALPGPEWPPPVAPGLDDAHWPVIEPDSYWGDWAQDFCLRTTFHIPDHWAPDAPVALHLPLGVAGDIFTHPEALLYVDGHPLASTDRHHHTTDLPARLRDGETHALALHGWTGLSGWPPDPASRERLFMRPCTLVEIDRELELLHTLAATALDTARHLPEAAPERARILTALHEAFLALDTAPPMGAMFYASVPHALATLRDGLAAAGPPMNVDLIAIGHAHMDLAYLWTVDQSRRKNGRTYSNVLGLMEAFEGYRFSHSQPQLYDYTRQDYPEIWEGIRARVAEGRWEAMGGMWVEPDANMVGPEALVRQIALGRRFFADHFGEGAETPVLWLPDTFGFPWSLPQLMAQAGLKWFVTNKVSWNQYNKMDHQLFRWEGIDGSQVIGHLLCTPRPVQYLPHPTTYKAEMTAAEVLGTWDYFQQKEDHSELPICFGFGDGGGGPTRELIVQAEAFDAMPGAPRVRMGTVREFFEGVEAAGTEALPVWADEINLELHRGVLTSQADMKRHNRRNEWLLHDAEFLAAWATEATGLRYPAETLTEAWKLLLKNQFHDILPGTAIAEVFEDARRDYGRINDLATGALTAAIDAIRARAPAGATHLAINPAPFGGTRIARLTGRRGLPPLRETATGAPIPAQETRSGTILEVPEVPAYGWSALAPGPAFDAPPGIAVRGDSDAPVLENDFYRLTLDANGHIASLIDRAAGREVLAGPGGVLQLFEDRPLNWDAWDIDAFFEDRPLPAPRLLSMEVVERGPIRATVRIERAFSRSRIIQYLSIWRTSRRIDFECEVDWRERHTLMKVAFPVNVRARAATYDIQWGAIERPTHRSTARDFARFEVAAQKWVDLSEDGFGVALLNDCKYGHDVKGNVLRLSLIKSATMPNPQADQGDHRFTYALMPHLGDWRGAVQREGYHLNDPLIVAGCAGGDGRLPAAGAVVACDRPGAVIETVTRAHAGDGTLIRLYESRGGRGPATLRFPAPVRLFAADLLERAREPIGEGTEIAIDLTPHRILTLIAVPS